MNTLKGYKTFIVAGLAALGAVLTAANINAVEAHPAVAVQLILVPVLMAILRAVTNTPPGKSS